MSDQSPTPSGLTIDGVAVPQHIEAADGAAIARYVAEQQERSQAAAPLVVPAVLETAPNPPTDAEGAES